jgi:hypothetical protein
VTFLKEHVLPKWPSPLIYSVVNIPNIGTEAEEATAWEAITRQLVKTQQSEKT